jgi:hypothetical protein
MYNSTCYVTLHRRKGEKIIVSPKFSNDFEALIFLNELLNDLNYFMKFYPLEKKNLFYNDDYLMAIEPEESCSDLYLETYEASGHRLAEICFETALGFIEKNSSFEK